MELEKVVADKFAEITASGFIEAQIKSAIEKTVKETIESCLRSYSDTGKLIEEKMKKALSLGATDWSLPEYNQLVATWVMDMVNKTLIVEGKAQIEKNLIEFFKPLEKNEWNISEIIEKFREDLSEDGEHGEITFLVKVDNTPREYVDFYFDKEEGKDRFECRYSLRVNKSGIWAANIDGDEAGKMKSPCLYGFDSFLFQLFATKAKVIDDSDCVETYYGESD